jgi:hypothetical protein
MGAAMLTQPLDLVKNRMQMAGVGEHKTSLHAIRSIIGNEGLSFILCY